MRTLSLNQFTAQQNRRDISVIWYYRYGNSAGKERSNTRASCSQSIIANQKYHNHHDIIKELGLFRKLKIFFEIKEDKDYVRYSNIGVLLIFKKKILIRLYKSRANLIVVLR